MMKRDYPRHLSTGFTLVELMVVIAIIAVLAALSIPVYNSMRYNGAVTQTVVNMKQVGIANESFSLENHGQVNGYGSQSLIQLGIKADKPHFWRVAGYVGTANSRHDGSFTLTDVETVLSILHHPHLPKKISHRPDTLRWTIAVNEEFEIVDGKFPRMGLYDAARTIYCVSGFNKVTSSQVGDSAYLELPETKRSGPYFTKRQQLPCLYLDGRVVLEKFPIDPGKFDPSLRE